MSCDVNPGAGPEAEAMAARYLWLKKALRIFWRHVRPIGGCWIWQASTNDGGYGYFRVGADRRKVLAHKFAAEIFTGPLPEGTQVWRHTCDTRACCAPWHLVPGTFAENARDMVERGRHARAGRKLSPRQVANLRAKAKTHGRRALARQYGISLSQVYKVVACKAWRAAR